MVAGLSRWAISPVSLSAVAEHTCSPGKLPDGTWGAWARHDADAGDVFVMVTSTGKTWEVVVSEVIRRGTAKALCRVVSLDQSVSRKAARLSR